MCRSSQYGCIAIDIRMNGENIKLPLIQLICFILFGLKKNAAYCQNIIVYRKAIKSLASIDF